jgi:hypothetical protein
MVVGCIAEVQSSAPVGFSLFPSLMMMGLVQGLPQHWASTVLARCVMPSLSPGVVLDSRTLLASAAHGGTVAQQAAGAAAPL